MNGFVPRAEYARLEQRVQRAERLVQHQDAQIKMLLQRIEVYMPLGDSSTSGINMGAVAHNGAASDPSLGGLGGGMHDPGMGDPSRGGMCGGMYGGGMGSSMGAVGCKGGAAVKGGMGCAGAKGGAASAGSRGGREQSRTPRAFKQDLPPVDMSQVVSFDEFVVANNLDAKCVEHLQAQPPEVVQFVIARGNAEGSNPSAMITARIAKCYADFNVGSSSQVPISSRVEEFIIGNQLDEVVAGSLRSQTPECQFAVISVGPADGRNPSAMIQGRIAKYNRGML